MLLYIEAPLLVLLLIEIVAACVLAIVRRGEGDDESKNGGATKEQVQEDTNGQTVPATKSGEYVRGEDAFLDRLTPDERAEFYNIFIYNSRCGLKYEVGKDNAEFFSGVFIYLGGVSYVVSDGLMRKICMEYDRHRGLPVTAENK